MCTGSGAVAWISICPHITISMPSFGMLIDVIYDIDHHAKCIKGDKIKSPLTFSMFVWGFFTPTQTHFIILVVGLGMI